MYTEGKYWKHYDRAHIDIVDDSSSQGNVLKIYDREGNGDGAFSDLFIEDGCLEAKQRVTFTGKEFFFYFCKFSLLIHNEYSKLT